MITNANSPRVLARTKKKHESVARFHSTSQERLLNLAALCTVDRSITSISFMSCSFDAWGRVNRITHLISHMCLSFAWSARSYKLLRPFAEPKELFNRGQPKIRTAIQNIFSALDQRANSHAVHRRFFWSAKIIVTLSQRTPWFGSVEFCFKLLFVLNST